MDGKKNDTLNMFYAVKTCVDRFQTTWTANAAFAASYNLFTGKIPLIEQYRDAQLIKSNGTTTDKNVRRKSVIDKSLFFINRITSYATVVGNNELRESVHFTNTHFSKSSDVEIVGIVDLILAKANANLTTLTNYGITSALVIDLQTALTAFSSYITKPRSISIQGKSATANLVILFKEANDLLKKRVDLDIEVFKNTKPDFYNQYRSARINISNSGSTSAVKGEIIDNETGELLKNVTLSFVLMNNGSLKTAVVNTKPVLVKKTAGKGKYRISKLSEGNYQVSMHKIGYKDQVVNITVANGETTVLNVGLDK